MNTLKYNDSKLKMFLQTLIFKPIGYFKETLHTRQLHEFGEQ